MLNSLFSALILFLHLALILLAPSLPGTWPLRYLSHHRSTKLRLAIDQRLEVAANRAVLSIQVKSQGANQQSVSEEIRSSQNDLMALLRPLTQYQNDHTQSANETQVPLTSPATPAIVRLGVNTFKANSHRTRQTILGEKPLYEASAEYEAEFADFDALGTIILGLTRTPRTRITSLKWKLSDTAREEAISKCQRDGTRMLSTKAWDTARTLGLRDVRAVEVHEKESDRRWERSQVLLDRDHFYSHDELGGFAAYRMVDEAARVEFEPQTLGYEVHLEGRFEAF